MTEVKRPEENQSEAIEEERPNIESGKEGIVVTREIKQEPGESNDHDILKEIPLHLDIKDDIDEVKIKVEREESAVRNEDKKAKERKLKNENVIELEDKTCNQLHYFCSVCFHHSIKREAVKVHVKLKHEVAQCKVCKDGLYRIVGRKKKSRRQVVFQVTVNMSILRVYAN